METVLAPHNCKSKVRFPGSDIIEADNVGEGGVISGVICLVLCKRLGENVQLAVDGDGHAVCDLDNNRNSFCSSRLS